MIAQTLKQIDMTSGFYLIIQVKIRVYELCFQEQNEASLSQAREQALKLERNGEKYGVHLRCNAFDSG
ncbi:hypothetical protein BFW38_08025 [Terasakiispira papahanaumokuakeensis]|uniref:Uncharacterized protein n=1 Tax=Terasakiispira papahanaumokuakeensis TaxID=197479 RepID=A0A1E2V9G6_9GAMM|nr:hypothetical protein BFW38_08025 [Terasakiispira papahanaumokuakeensis]